MSFMEREKKKKGNNSITLLPRSSKLNCRCREPLDTAQVKTRDSWRRRKEIIYIWWSTIVSRGIPRHLSNTLPSHLTARACQKREREKPILPCALIDWFPTFFRLFRSCQSTIISLIYQVEVDWFIILRLLFALRGPSQNEVFKNKKAGNLNTSFWLIGWPVLMANVESWKRRRKLFCFDATQKQSDVILA